MSDAPTDYKATVFLPRTEFPMRGDLPTREPQALARWEAMGMWDKLRAAAKGKPPFILHDGPPYANGNLHIGHALNKIHKDVINRAQQMAGRDANYIPGWDCHGLPIEWKVEEKYRAKKLDKDEVPVLEFRRECREYAQHWLNVQAEEFKRLGVAGDWAHRYATMDFESEALIAGEIGKFLLNGALYRGLRPVMWSPVEKTALAEAEVEYHDKKDTAIYVRFRAVDAAESIVIWTTTPWTIPGNRGLAAGPELDYVRVRVDATAEGSLAVPGEVLIISQELLADVCAKVGIAAHTVLENFKGITLKDMRFHHPLAQIHEGYNFSVQVMLGDFVTMEAGTGIVHMAPGHGEDDFALCKANGILVPDTVADDGTYYPSVPLFAGVHVYKAADPVCAALTQAGALLHRAEFMHSYPHSWRSKAPLIYRATAQWFIRMDGEKAIRAQALAAIDATHFVPEIGRNRIRSMVESRPDWCISRQRAWGVPIAIFVDKHTHEPLRDAAVMARIVEIFKTEGADAWYARPAQDFLGDDYKADDYEQIMDVVDVWFESGSTHAFVLAARGLPVPADVYLEGSDQHRGWFQASLLESVGAQGFAPFKAIVTDGFVLDEQGRKMSKSMGNVTAPQEVNDKYGADILRLWVMNSDTSEDLRIGPEILKQQAELYRRLRNTLRWILGSLDGFTEAEKLPEAAFPELEKLMLHRLWELDALVQQAIISHDWTGVYPAIHHFCATDLSAFYFDIRKDALYCDRAGSQKRRACRTVLDILHRCLTAWLAPALPFTAEESWVSRFGESVSVHLTLFPEIPAAWRDDALAETWAGIRAQRSDITGAIEAMRRDKTIGSSLQAVAVISPAAKNLLGDDATWADICITSGAGLGDANGAAMAPGTKCERCWRVLPEVGENKTHPTLCIRCCEAVAP
ncbi:MAG: isoleucine--tRNA ligase [Acidocella sp.]|nr:isoleucine--tRNA ligase [Acidocella sp.]